MSARDAQFRDVDGATVRVRSIWLTQLSLGVSIIIISVVSLGYEPELFTSWLMLTGVAIVILAMMLDRMTSALADKGGARAKRRKKTSPDNSTKDTQASAETAQPAGAQA